MGRFRGSQPEVRAGKREAYEAGTQLFLSVSTNSCVLMWEHLQWDLVKMEMVGKEWGWGRGVPELPEASWLLPWSHHNECELTGIDTSTERSLRFTRGQRGASGGGRM